MSKHWIRKEFRHCHPIDLATHHRRNDKRVEVADVICRQHESAIAICIFTPHNVDTGNASKQQLHQYRCNLISR
jgi:hypothetical protein